MIRLFKKKKESKNWYDISLAQFKKIKELLSDIDDYTAFNLMDVVYDIDSTSMPISQLNQYSIEFLKKDLPTTKLKKHYNLNNVEYDSHYDLTEIKTSQFIDYQNYLKEGAEFEKLLSVFFTPKGHEYNDGYDIKKVQEDLLSLDIVTVNSAAFFFKSQLIAYTTLFQQSLIRQIKKMKIDKTKKKEVINLLKQMDLASLVSFTGCGTIPIKQIHL